MNLHRLSASQRFLYNTIASMGVERARVSVQKSQLTVNQAKKLQETVRLLQSDQTRIIVNVDLQKVYPASGLSVIDGLMGTGRFLNRFEIELASSNPLGPNMLSKIMEEFVLYGAKSELIYVLALLPAGEHPFYGALDFIGNPGALPMLGYYGPYRFRLKKETVERSTFTAGSIAVIPSSEIYTWGSIEGVLVTPFTANGRSKFLFEYIIDKLESVDYSNQFVYIESQTLGGVLLKEDVDLLYYPAVDIYSNFFPKLEKLSEQFAIPLQSY